MTSLAGRVSAAAGAFLNTQAIIAVNQKWRNYKISTLSLPKPNLPTPIPTWTLETEIDFRSLKNSGSVQQSPPTTLLWMIGLPNGENLDRQLVTQFCNPLKSYRIRRRRSCREPGVCLFDSVGDSDAATAVVEECTAAIQRFKVRKASVAAWSLLFTWSIISIITTTVLCGLQWVDKTCTREQEYIKPRLKRLKIQSEAVRYWASISCSLFLWLSVAFFLHSQAQRWEMSTMVLAVSDGAFDPGGSFCHSLWPNTGLGCHLSFL